MSETQESLSSIMGSTFDKGETAAPPAAEPKVEAPAVETPKTETVTEAPKVETPRDESGRFAPKVEAEKEPPAPREFAGYLDERRKRQAAESELAKLRATQPKKDFWEDPEAAVDAKINDPIKSMQDQIADLRIALAKTQMPGFDDAAFAFMKVAQNDPAMMHALDTAPNQLEYLYREGNRLKELAPYGGDLSKRDEAKFGELKGEVAKRDQEIAALKAQLEGKTRSEAELAAVPRSLNQVQSGAAPKVSDADDEDLGKIARFR